MQSFKDDCILIDGRTAQSHAAWWISSKGTSEYTTEGFIKSGMPPIAYPGENYTLRQSRMLTQDIPLRMRAST